METRLKGCKARKKPYLSVATKKWVLWVKEYQDQTDEDWGRSHGYMKTNLR